MNKNKMKKIILFILSLNFSMAIIAQRTHVIEPAEIQVQYRTTFEKSNDLMILRCGKNAYQYFSFFNYRRDSLMSSPDISINTIPLKESLEAIKHPDDPAKQLPSSPSHGDYIYGNLTSNVNNLHITL